MIVDTLYALCKLGLIYCSWNAGRCSYYLAKEGRYILPILAIATLAWLGTHA